MKKLVGLILQFYVFLAIGQTNGVQPLSGDFKELMSVRNFTLSNNGDEAYFTVQSLDESRTMIVRAEYKKGEWRNFKKLPFCGTHRDIEPFLSPDNLRLYFASDRPKKKNPLAADFDIWYVERKSIDKPWSEPINLGAPVNTSANEFFPSVTNSGNLYFTSDAFAKTKKDEIFRSEWNGETFLKPEVLSDQINSEGYEFNAFISPKEDYLIFTVYQGENGLGSGDLYISYRDKKGNFSMRKHMGESVNSTKMDYCPFYDEENQTLYFTSKRSSISEKTFKNLAEFKEEINRYENGLSRLYSLKIDVFLFKPN